MSSFFLINKTQSEKIAALQQTFEKRGFKAPKVVATNAGCLFVYPRLNGMKTWYAEKERHFLAVHGTLWYRNTIFPDCGSALLQDLQHNKLNHEAISGSFALLWVDDNRDLSIIHDAYACNRFYLDRITQIISSSFLSLTWLKERKVEDINKHAVIENLVLGFNIGNKTWINEIERVVDLEQLKSHSISYTRQVITNISYNLSGFGEAVHQSVKLLSETLVPKMQAYPDKVVLGLSSGFDSRLLAATIPKDMLLKTSFFTFHKPGDRDPVIAEAIAKALSRPLCKIESLLPISKNEKEAIQNKAFLFFDGQCATMMQYTKPDYTADFRKKVFDPDELHLSGVGGELFRNYNFDHRNSLNMEFWVDQYFAAGLVESWLKNKKYLQLTINELKERLSIHTKKISYEKRKLFYGNVFLSDWHGIRNTVENQYAPYYSPFTDPKIKALSYNTITFQGDQGEFEAAMIRELSYQLACLPTAYGHTLINIPATTRWNARIRAWFKNPLLSKVRKIKSINKNMGQKYLPKYPILDQLIGSDVYVSKVARNKPELTSTAEFSLKQILNKSDI